jgi:hypothetical protein
MTASRDPDRLIHAFLHEGLDELPYPVYDAVRDRIEQTRQRAFIGPWRASDMNRYLKIGLAAAAVVVIAVVGYQFLGNSNTGGPGASESAEPSATAAPSEPVPTARVGLPDGPVVVTTSDDPVQVTVNIASSGWNSRPQLDAVDKDDDGLDAPEYVGALLAAWAWPAGTGFNVYGDPCHWSTTIPATPATTPDEIAAAFAAQALSDSTAPVNVTVGGFAGKTITLHVPMSFDLPNATRDEKFAACDEFTFAFYGIEGETGVARNAQGAGQIDELWILDINGAIVILDAGYSPSTPASLVEEIRALAESATFELP